MSDRPKKLPTLEQLREFVRRTLARSMQLDPEQFVLTETPLLRRGEPCGMTFCMRGPRLARLTAIWAAREQAVYFYDSAGQRFQKVQLETGPDLPGLAA